VDIGSSYLPSELLAAYLYAQLESWELIHAKRRRIWERYAEGLGPWARENGVRLPVVPAECEQPYHMFYVIMPSLELRTGLIASLKARGILSVFHYLPLHLSEMGIKLGGRAGQCPVTECVSDCLLRLPFYNDLTESEQDEVIDAICSFPMARASTNRAG
jgi:dTDP-4-amino-4,6-dideoxygalactose transaminase